MRLTLGHNGIDANCVASPSAGCVTEAAKAHGFGTSGSDDGLQAERITTCPDRNECMRLALLLVFVAYPLLELALLIRAGQAIGFWPVFAIIIGTGLLGVAILRRQGFKVVEKVSAALEEGREPVAPLADSALVFAAGSMLISPGLVGDTIGLLLLIPQLRHLIRHTISARVLGSSTIVVRRSRTSATTAEPRPPSGPGKIIEGEWERLDEDPRDRP